MRMAVLFLWLAAIAEAQTQLVLQKAWANKVQNLVSLDIHMEVDHSLPEPHRAGKCCSDDGDIHFSGRSSEIGLPMVAEIMNAATQPQALAELKAAANGSIVPTSGVWRLWFEHAGGDQIQGKPVQVPDGTNPAHVFEIHPVIEFNGDSVAGSFSPVDGLLPYDGSEAFPHYEKQTVSLQAGSTSITISSTDLGYNYTHFVIELAGSPVQTSDGGLLALARIMENDEESLVEKPIRIVAAKGTPPEQAIRGQKAGAQFHVMGIPRINLNQVLSILSSGGQAPIQAKLPYEMIIVAVCSDDLSGCLQR